MSKVITINKSIKDDRLTDMFAQMTGSKEADPAIIMPKYNNVRKLANVIIKTLDKFGNNAKLRSMFPNFIVHFDEVLTYVKNLNASMQYDVISEDQIDEKNIHTLYKTLKNDENVRQISIICARLRKDFTLIDSLNIYFIANQSDNIFSPFPFTTINFTNLWAEMPESNENGDVIKKYILTVLKKIMEKSYEIHNIIISPDIDIEEFSHALVDAIAKARQMLPRCQMAFDKIEESVHMLKNNFGDYYKSFMISKNPTSILESFIVDVSKNQKGSTKLKWQFMQIVNFYRKNSAGKVAKDSNLKYIFDTLDVKLDQLDKATSDESSTEPEDDQNAS